MRTIKALTDMIQSMEQDLFPFPIYTADATSVTVKPSVWCEVKYKLTLENHPLAKEKPFVKIDTDYMSQSTSISYVDAQDICDYIRSLCVYR